MLRCYLLLCCLVIAVWTFGFIRRLVGFIAVCCVCFVLLFMCWFMIVVMAVVDCLLVFNGLYALRLGWCVSFICWLGSLGLLLFTFRMI